MGLAPVWFLAIVVSSVSGLVVSISWDRRPVLFDGARLSFVAVLVQSAFDKCLRKNGKVYYISLLVETERFRFLLIKEIIVSPFFSRRLYRIDLDGFIL